MENNLKIVLSLGEMDSVSELKTRIYEEELKELNSKNPLKKNEIDVNHTYFVKNDDILEVGLFIRNGLSQSLSLEEMPLVIVDVKGNKIITESFDFGEFGVIPARSARPVVVNFQLPKSLKFNEGEAYSIKFDTQDNMEAFPSVATEIEDMPNNLSFEQEKALIDFANGLPTLKADEFSISVYDMNYTIGGGLNCTLLIRNGKDQEAKLEKLPIAISNEEGLIFARCVFENQEGLVKISPNKSKFATFEFKSSDVMPGKYDLSKCQVLYM